MHGAPLCCSKNSLRRLVPDDTEEEGSRFVLFIDESSPAPPDRLGARVVAAAAATAIAGGGGSGALATMDACPPTAGTSPVGEAEEEKAGIGADTGRFAMTVDAAAPGVAPVVPSSITSDSHSSSTEGAPDLPPSRECVLMARASVGPGLVPAARPEVAG
eukprot:CAMPEP_0206305058 /NCGR_PEP_ID=MMETSP0106_2-20121207/10064_1 /ASSEMBLY_ACC=CAM_ASM_000206 /TAXON_ID=81532 /ORGANISM="Acanthoeca-like sp., Strain 10tr" /LENGTH=159 /DNA_ID=CAMNT_0053735887 /DNA_START=361 /DNA_END=836 /DNA_ORIENTATION=-